MSVENKNALIYRGGGFIGGALAWTFAILTSRTFLNYMTLASMTTQLQGKAA